MLVTRVSCILSVGHTYKCLLCSISHCTDPAFASYYGLALQIGNVEISITQRMTRGKLLVLPSDVEPLCSALKVPSCGRCSGMQTRRSAMVTTLIPLGIFVLVLTHYHMFEAQWPQGIGQRSTSDVMSMATLGRSHVVTACSRSKEGHI